MPKSNGFTRANISFCVWNVGGLVSKSYNKVNDENFIKEIRDYDIVLLTETHLGYNSQVNIENFKYFPVCRPQSANTRFYGGLGILIKNSIRQGVKILTNTNKDYQWLKLDKSFFNFMKDIFLCLAYIIPSNSSYAKQSSEDILDSIEKDIIYKYKKDGDIILCGDFNARSGSEPDFIQNDNYGIHIPVHDDYECDVIQELRNSYDSKLDTRGKQLLEFCISTKMRILNGRVIGDLLGKYTCHKPTGSSVVDYIILSEELLTSVLYFKVSDFIPHFSDCHCKLSLNLLAKYSTNVTKHNFKLKRFPNAYHWDSSSTVKFQDALCHPTCKKAINIFMERDLDALEDPDIPTSEFINILDKAASSAKILRNKPKKKANSSKWFDNDLGTKRKSLLEKADLFSKFPNNPIIRGSYYKCYREYNKLRKYKKRHFKQSVLDGLDILRDSDPKKYWKLINSLKESSGDNKTDLVEPDSWYSYFSNLNNIHGSNNQRISELENILNNIEKLKEFSPLDYRITTKEITDAIQHLKNGKASGLDGIPSEMLKAGCTVLTPLLLKLFNFIFSTGRYPVQWSSAYLCPIYKSGDAGMPENYRGIAINSCIGKLFNSILNNRLDKYLIDNNIINKSQIGFSKKARTSDHIFVLKTLIDKYVNSKGGKLFACFVDLRKAFDTVIHVGIRYKLISYGISGKFYSIIKDMYKKSELCVKINDKNMTPVFRSFVGVRQGDVLSPNLFKLF